MKERLFDTALKLGAMFSIKRATRIEGLQARVVAWRRLTKLQNLDEWKVIEQTFDTLYFETIEELSTKGISVENRFRCCNRLEFVRDIRLRFEKIMRSGEAALPELTKLMKENENVR